MDQHISSAGAKRRRLARRSPLVSALALPMALLACLTVSAEAADPAVAYAIDARGTRESGMLEGCTSDTGCGKRIASLSLTITIYVRRQHREARISIRGGDPGCCYFAYGADAVQLYEPLRFHELPILEGRARMGNEFVLNRKIGTLYIGFANLQ